MVYMFKESGIDVGLEIISDATNSLSQVLVEVIIKKNNSQVYQSGTLESSVEAQKTNKRVKIKACPSLKPFFHVTLCPCYRYIRVKCKDLQRQRKIYHVLLWSHGQCCVHKIVREWKSN